MICVLGERFSCKRQCLTLVGSLQRTQLNMQATAELHCKSNGWQMQSAPVLQACARYWDTGLTRSPDKQSGEEQFRST